MSDVEIAIREAVEACLDTIKAGVPIADKISFVQGYLASNPLFSNFTGPVPAQWIQTIIEEERA
jgi:hypothetical protein